MQTVDKEVILELETVNMDSSEKNKEYFFAKLIF